MEIDAHDDIIAEKYILCRGFIENDFIIRLQHGQMY